MGRQDRPRREPKKAPKERVPMTGPELEKKAPKMQPLVPRDCPYRQYTGHYLITCPMCLGFPID